MTCSPRFVLQELRDALTSPEGRKRAELHAPAVLSQVQELLENLVYSRRHHAGPRLGIYAGADSHAQLGRHGLRNRGLLVFRGSTRTAVCFGRHSLFVWDFVFLLLTASADASSGGLGVAWTGVGSSVFDA